MTNEREKPLPAYISEFVNSLNPPSPRQTNSISYIKLPDTRTTRGDDLAIMNGVPICIQTAPFQPLADEWFGSYLLKRQLSVYYRAGILTIAARVFNKIELPHPDRYVVGWDMPTGATTRIFMRIIPATFPPHLSAYLKKIGINTQNFSNFIGLETTNQYPNDTWRLWLHPTIRQSFPKISKNPPSICGQEDVAYAFDDVYFNPLNPRKIAGWRTNSFYIAVTPPPTPLPNPSDPNDLSIMASRINAGDWMFNPPGIEYYPINQEKPW